MTDTRFDRDLEQGYLAESRDLLANVESDLLAIEHGGSEIDELVAPRSSRSRSAN